MITLDIKISSNTWTPKSQRARQQLSQLPREAFKVFYDSTPIRTGYARSQTRLASNQIQAQYNYAQRLDNGYSRQSPQGMSKPTEQYIKRRIKQIQQGR